MKGKRIAIVPGGVSEYFLYFALNVVGLTPSDVQMEPRDTVAEAVLAYLNGEVDAVSGWEPNVLDAEAQGGKTLIASDSLRTILDVLVTSRPALENKTEAVQAFHDAWYEALRLMIDEPTAAGQAIVSWESTEWTGISTPDDLSIQLERLAQATLGSNQLAFQSNRLLAGRLQLANQIWASIGQAEPSTIDFSQLVDGQFVLASARHQDLFSLQLPVNSSFLLTSRTEGPGATVDPQTLDTVARLPIEQVDFESDTARLTPQAIDELTTHVLPVLQQSNLSMHIQGSAAWPGPDGRFTEDQVLEFANERAIAVASFLTQRGIAPTRLLISTVQPQFPNSLNEEELAQDRIVKFVLVKSGL
ncbi:MAG: ABC transporter substrate-binding protein [Blastochloris sp.]|nr:ABC transporter substrate-binding protein [Blastochloris sp.]